MMLKSKRYPYLNCIDSQALLAQCEKKDKKKGNHINLIFFIAAYGSYEDCWTNTLRTTIRENMIEYLNRLYAFFRIKPQKIPVTTPNGIVLSWPFTQYFRTIIEGKAYKENDDHKGLILAFEKGTPAGDSDYHLVSDEIKNAIIGGSFEIPVELKP